MNVKKSIKMIVNRIKQIKMKRYEYMYLPPYVLQEHKVSEMLRCRSQHWQITTLQCWYITMLANLFNLHNIEWIKYKVKQIING
jgi:hypothetical protein